MLLSLLSCPVHLNFLSSCITRLCLFTLLSGSQQQPTVLLCPVIHRVLVDSISLHSANNTLSHILYIFQSVSIIHWPVRSNLPTQSDCSHLGLEEICGLFCADSGVKSSGFNEMELSTGVNRSTESTTLLSMAERRVFPNILSICNGKIMNSKSMILLY